MSPQETTCQTKEVNQRPEISTTCLVPFLLTGLGTAGAGFHRYGVCGPHRVEHGGVTILLSGLPAAQTVRHGDETEEQQRCNEGPHPD